MFPQKEEARFTTAEDYFGAWKKLQGNVASSELTTWRKIT
jgi:hypothetical protein